MSDELKRLEEEEEKLRAKLKRKREALRQAKRKRDTQRKVIVGAAALKLCETDPALARRIEAAISEKDRGRVGRLVKPDTEQKTERPRIPLQPNQ